MDLERTLLTAFASNHPTQAGRTLESMSHSDAADVLAITPEDAAATVGGQTLLTHTDILAGRALAADFTNQGWRDSLGYDDVPVYSADEAGRQLWRIAQDYDFVFFEHQQGKDQ